MALACCDVVKVRQDQGQESLSQLAGVCSVISGEAEPKREKGKAPKRTNHHLSASRIQENKVWVWVADEPKSAVRVACTIERRDAHRSPLFSHAKAMNKERNSENHKCMATCCRELRRDQPQQTNMCDVALTWCQLQTFYTQLSDWDIQCKCNGIKFEFKCFENGN